MAELVCQCTCIQEGGKKNPFHYIRYGDACESSSPAADNTQHPGTSVSIRLGRIGKTHVNQIERLLRFRDSVVISLETSQEVAIL